MIVFFGSSQYSIPALKALLGAGFKPMVVSILTGNPLTAFAQSQQLTVIKPKKLDKKNLEKLKSQKPKLGVCCVYGKIIPQNWLDLFQKGIINIHPSLLPLYRGASPATFSILRNEKQTGLTFILMDKKCDHGPIIKQFKTKLQANETADLLYQRLFSLAAKNLVPTINHYLTGKLKPSPQDHQKASYSRLLKREDGFVLEKSLKKALKGKQITSSQLPQIVSEALPGIKTYSPLIIDRLRKAFTPWPGIYTRIKIKDQDKLLKILKTHLEKNKLVIDEVQLEGKKPVIFSQFSSAYSWPC